MTTLPTPRWLFLTVFLLTTYHVPAALAQKTATVPINQPSPFAPTLALTKPAGIQRGTSLELVLTGTNLAGPTGLWTSFPATVTIPTDHLNGADAGRLRVRLETPKETPVGFHSIRLATKCGLSNFRLFCVDDLPKVAEVDTNHEKAGAQSLPVPCVVTGKADAEQSDFFKISVSAKQRLSFELLGRRLGSGFDPQLTLLDAQTGRELAGGYSNDAPGGQTDPRLSYTFAAAGDYLIEVRDVQYRGGADFVYRLRIGDFPLATTPFPLAVKRGTTTSVNFAGSAVAGVVPVTVVAPSDPAVDSVEVTPKGPSGFSGWPVTLTLSDLTEVVETEPNNEPAQATRVPVPGAVNARFATKGDVDCFVFAGKKGQRLLIDAHTAELGAPTEVYLTLKDAKGTELAVTTPAVAPPGNQRLDFTPPDDGDYTIVAEHLLYWGGPTETYRLTIAPPRPSFELALQLDRFDLPAGGGALVAVQATRFEFNGAIDLTVTGTHSGLGGHAVLPAGQTLALMYVTAKSDVPLGPYSITIAGSAQVDGTPRVVPAMVRALASQTLAGLPFPPRLVRRQVGVAVVEKPPFQLSAKFDPPEAVRGPPTTLIVTTDRANGFTDEIVLAALNLPSKVTAALKNIPKGKNEVRVQLTPAANAALGTFPIALSGAAKFMHKDYLLTTPPLELVVGPPVKP